MNGFTEIAASGPVVLALLVSMLAGLVSFALHTAHEAGWVDFGQAQLLDLSWLIRPGSVQSALLTGVLGIQPKPTVVEVVGWLVYFVPVSLVVLASARRKPTRTQPAPVEAAGRVARPA